MYILFSPIWVLITRNDKSNTPFRFVASLAVSPTQNKTIQRWSHIPSAQLPARRYHVLANHARPKAVQANTAVQLLEHAVLPIRAGLRQIRVQHTARRLDRRVRAA